MKNQWKDIVQYGVCVICIIGAMVMSFIAMFIEPEGLLDQSVLWLIAQVLVFCGSIFGLSNYVGNDTKINKRISDLEDDLKALFNQQTPNDNHKRNAERPNNIS